MKNHPTDQEVYQLCSFMFNKQKSRGCIPVDKNGTPHTLETLFKETIETFKSDKFQKIISETNKE